MSLNREECNVGYKKRYGRELSDDDYQAFLFFMNRFGVDAETYEEAYTKVEASLFMWAMDGRTK